MKPKAPVSSLSQEALERQLKGFLFQIEHESEQLRDEASRSYSLLAIGEKTTLTQFVESLLNNPLEILAQRKNLVDSQIREVVDILVKYFLVPLSDKVVRVFKTLSESDDLHYCIVLKEDNEANRSLFYDILETIQFNELGRMVPVYFRFVGEKSSHHIPCKEVIIGG